MKWWIDRSRLMGSCNPTQDELDIEGLTAVVSLLDLSEQELNYDPETLEAKWYSIPVKDFTAPSLEDLFRFIEIVEGSEGTVLVHCQGGSGRTGTFGAAWLMRHDGSSAAEAIGLIRKKNPHAVETEGQKEVLELFEKRNQRL
jgi:protein-tyrosine phosphatase